MSEDPEIDHRDAGCVADRLGEQGRTRIVVDPLRRERRPGRDIELLANLAHELRTPLTPVKGYALLLQENKLDREQVHAFAREITTASAQLERVVDALIRFASLENVEAISAAPVAVDRLAAELVGRWKQRSDDHELHLEVQRSVVAGLGYRRLLDVALDELLDNAIKFSPDGGRIVVGVGTVHVGDARWIRLSVRDHGVGLPIECAQLLEPFRQGDGSATRRFGGLGLGLAIVDRIARAHCGRVLLMPNSPTGAIAAIEFPARDHDQPGGGEIGGSRGSLLLSDDRPGLRIDLASEPTDHQEV